MPNSLVIESAIQGFETAESEPEKQPQLAYLKSVQETLFTDIYATLKSIEIAPDILASKAGGQFGKSWVLPPGKLTGWIAVYPQGVAWPITVAATVPSNKIAMPMRIVVMVPLNSVGSNLQVPRGVARYVLTNESGASTKQWIGRSAAIFLGLQCDAKGAWEYGLTIGWCCLSDTGDAVCMKPVPIVLEPLIAAAEKTGTSLFELSNQNLHNSLFDEIGLVINETPNGPML